MNSPGQKTRKAWMRWIKGASLVSLFLLVVFLLDSSWIGPKTSFTQTWKNEKTKPNRLIHSDSPYLKSAAYQPIDWYEYGDEAFLQAQMSNRVILLDVGAIWCHWCHVMDEETYENDEVAKIINENFIAIKLDRDMRPDLDRRYQTAIQAIVGQGGWPLTVFMTPEGKVFYGGTFFPADDNYGRIGFKNLLPRITQAYQKNKKDIDDSGTGLMNFLHRAITENQKMDSIRPELVDKILTEIKFRFDRENGGLGSAPKFPNGSVVELLISKYHATKEPDLLEIITKTLNGMGHGGIHDQVGGGFHRYSVDSGWNVPHFEKMAYTNSELLVNYVHGYQITGNPYYWEVAERIVQFVMQDLSDKTKGGFYSSIDADTKEGGEGGYYSWTVDEIKAILKPEETEVIIPYFSISKDGDLREQPGKNVLRISSDWGSIQKSLNKKDDEIRSLIQTSIQKLSTERNKRESPYLDKTIYSGLNGMMISAFLEFGKFKKNSEARALALKSLDRILTTLYEKGKGIRHSSSTPLSVQILQDQVFVADACLSAFEATGEIRYLNVAEDLMDYILRNFWDHGSGGFFDTPVTEDLKYIPLPMKPFIDNPYISANSKAVEVLNKLYLITTEKKYSNYSEKTLLALPGGIDQANPFNSGYALALRNFIYSPTHVVILGRKGDVIREKLWEKSLTTYRPGKLVSVFDPDESENTPYPPSEKGETIAYVCTGKVCSTPSSDPIKIETLIKTQKG